MAIQQTLFPDLLDQSDLMHRQQHYVCRGHGVWSIASTHRVRSEAASESRHLVVEYDDERYAVYKTGKPWIVEIRHYIGFNETVVTGRGKSRKAVSVRRQRRRVSFRAFETRAMAVDFAEKLKAIISRLNIEKD
jgi:hypothetical protein